MYRSQWLFFSMAVLATVGWSNFAQFPLLLARYGSFFLLIYVAVLLMVAVPVVMAEIAIGRHGRSSPASSIELMAVEGGLSPGWRYLGYVMVATGLLVASYTLVTGAWSWELLLMNLRGESEGKPLYDLYHVLFDHLRQWQWQLGLMLVVALVVSWPKRIGVYLLSALLVLLLWAMVLFIVYQTSVHGLSWRRFSTVLFWQWPENFWSVSLKAVEQAFFSLSVGIGLIVLYSNNLPRNISIGDAAIAVVFVDLLFSIVFSVVVWSWLPIELATNSSATDILFVQMPAAILGVPLLQPLWYLLLGVTALATLVLLIEAGSIWIIERWRWWRMLAVLPIIAIVLLFSLPLALTFGEWSQILFYGRQPLVLLSGVTSVILIPLSGLLLAFFIGWVVPSDVIRNEINPRRLFRYWYWRVSLKFITTGALLALWLKSLEHNLRWPLELQVALLFLLPTLVWSSKRVKRLLTW